MEWMVGGVCGVIGIVVGVLFGWCVVDKVGIGGFGMMIDVVVLWLLVCVLIVMVVLFM